jgi:hypothetical protein
MVGGGTWYVWGRFVIGVKISMSWWTTIWTLDLGISNCFS